MKKLFLCACCFLITMATKSQEAQENASVFLEEYTDEFQENFFNALQQKGIENYDRAIEYLLICVELQPDLMVLQYELGKNYLYLRNFALAEEHLRRAFELEPENKWAIAALYDLFRIRNNDFRVRDLIDKTGKRDIGFMKNLLGLTMRLEDWQEALFLVQEIKNSSGTTKVLETRELYLKALLSESLKKKAKTFKKLTRTDKRAELITEIDALLNNLDFDMAKETAATALLSWPAQPYFYYAYGVSLAGLGEHKEAVVQMLMALDFLIGDQPLEKRIYRALVDSYTALNQQQKAARYRNKI